jgi:DNA (cytosine-5)-methyltransferase 1
MRHGSLFSGIGGFDLASECMGWDNVFHCEVNPFCQKILSYYWPHATQLHDIKTTDFTQYANNIDILTGGFPCQPFSSAGKRLGTNDDRHLWPYMLRAIQQVKPRWIVAENVLGIINWSEGMVIEAVLSDLESEGYQVQTYVLPTAGIGSPHKRQRVYVVAFREDVPLTTANANSDGLQRHVRTEQNNIETRFGQIGVAEMLADYARTISTAKWESFPTQSPIRNGDDGLPFRLDGTSFRKWRDQLITGAGNAVVPQMIYQIFQTIKLYEENHSTF